MKPIKQPRRVPSRRDAQKTRDRLMIEAGKAFARHGYEGANLRAICKSAKVNLGAVKYYFGSKKELYREALIQPHIKIMKEEEPPHIGDSESPEEALKEWIAFFMRAVLVRRGKHPYLSRLIIREIASPTFALDELIQTVFKGIREKLVTIVSTLTGHDQEDRKVGELANMIIMLCVQQEMGRSIFERVGYPPPTTEKEVLALAEKVYRFALSGVRTWA